MKLERIGPYRIDAELGSGGMGRVYRAVAEGRDAAVPPGTVVALKVLRPHLLEAPGFFKRFLREAEAGKAVRHPNVVRTLDVDAVVQDGVHHHFLVMEFVEGQVLRALLEELGRLPEELCRHVGLEVALALEALHAAGVVHRDLKPENVLVTPDHQVKLMDLGVARLADELVRISQTGEFVGSLQYAAPEQFSAEELDGRADLYALGLCLYELATGQHPVLGSDTRNVIRRHLEGGLRSPAEINPQLSPFFEEVVKTLTARERDDRFASASELAEVLRDGEQSAWWSGVATHIRQITQRPLRRIRVPREAALEGRSEELDRLRALYEAVRGGEGRVVLVQGEAGIGKTRLVDEFVEGLWRSGDDFHFLFGGYPPGGAATAAGAFSTAYREHFGTEGLEDTLRGYLVETPLLVPSFAAVLRGDATPTGAEPLTRESLQTVFVNATRALARERPTVVLVDDLHYTPPEGLGIFAALALAVEEHPVMLIGTARPGLQSGWVADLERRAHTSSMMLGRLSPREVGHLVRRMFGSDTLAEELGFQIVTKSDGNPFFVFEIVHGLEERGLLSRMEDGTWVRAGETEIREIEIPSSVLDLIDARVANLADGERELLDVAACCGFEFDPLLVAEAMGLERTPALKTLARVEKTSRLVHSVGRRFVFDHHQVQEALYAGLPELLREDYHVALGDALERRHPGTDATGHEPAVAHDLCEHFFSGGAPDRAWPYVDRALRHLEEGYLNAAAVRLADRALVAAPDADPAARLELMLRKSERLGLLGWRPEEQEGLHDARALAEASGDAAARNRVELRLVAYGLAVGEMPAAREAAERCLADARRRADRAQEATAVGLVAQSSYSMGDYEAARRASDLHRTAVADLGDPRQAAESVGILALVLHAQDRHDDARREFQRFRALARENGDRRAEARATGNLGNVFRDLGLFEEARGCQEALLSLAREIGDRHGEGRATGSLANLFGALGQWALAREHQERFLGLSRETGNRLGESIALVNLGPLLGRLGDLRGGREAVEDALSLSRRIGAARIEGAALTNLGVLAEISEEFEDADRRYRQAIKARRRIGNRSGLSDTLAYAGRACAAARDGAAAPLLDESLALAAELGRPTAWLLAGVHRAGLEGGDVPTALDLFARFSERVERRERMEAAYALWRITGDAAHLAAAHRDLALHVEHAPPEARVAMVERVPLHRGITQAWEASSAGRGGKDGSAG